MVFALVLWAIANLPWHLDEYDQAKQAFTSFEMVNLGHWSYQHTPNGGVATKPPLVGWVSAGLFYLTGVWEWAWRLPSFIAALLLLFLITRAASVYGNLASLIAAAAFSLNFLTPRLATLVRTDMPLALFVFAIGWLIWEKIRRRETFTARDRVLLFVLLSVAMLTKGPIVYAFVLLAFVIYRLQARALGESAIAWTGWWPWLGSFAVFLVWVDKGVLAIPGFWENVVVREFAGRFGDVVHRPQPIYFYFPHFLFRFAPWSFLLIALTILGCVQDRLKFGERLRAISPETFWLTVWSLSGLLLMSFVPSKRIDRIFPILPPLCLLLAAQVGWLQSRPEKAALVRRYCALAIVIGCLLTGGYVIRRVSTAYRNDDGSLATFGRKIREEAQAHGWRYQVIGGRHEGLLLYLRKTEFLRPEQGIAEWNNGRIDGLVVPQDQLNALLPKLTGAVPSAVGQSDSAGHQEKRYVFLVRDK